MKHRSNCGHFCPEHISDRASILAHAELDSGSVLISARSPVSVVFSHSRMIWSSAGLLPAPPAPAPFRHRKSSADRRSSSGLSCTPRESRESQVFFEEGNVLEVELFLQILGPGGHDHSLAAENRRNQIGERLAGTCARFDNQVLLFPRARSPRLPPYEAAPHGIHRQDATAKAGLSCRRIDERERVAGCATTRRF